MNVIHTVLQWQQIGVDLRWVGNGYDWTSENNKLLRFDINGNENVYDIVQVVKYIIKHIFPLEVLAEVGILATEKR